MALVFSPTTIEEACQLLATPGRVLCAGATNLYVDAYQGRFQISEMDIISLHRLEVLKTLSLEEDGLHIGSLCTFSQLEKALSEENFPKSGRPAAACSFAALQPLAQAAASIGGPQIRNRGTIGGNILSASPAADTVPVLMALDASLVLTSLSGERRVPIQGFMTGPRQTAIQPDELLTEIILPPRQGKARFEKVGKRNALAIAVCNLCVYTNFIGSDPIPTIAIAIGSCAPTCLRATKTEHRLKGYPRPTKEEEWRKLKRIIATELAGDISPIDDIRATASYRQAVASNLVYKLIRESWEEQA